MARIRTIKPEFWSNEGLSELPEATHLLAAALLNYADDDGYFNANPKLIRAECSPLREPSVPTTVSVQQLQTIGYIDLGTGTDGRRYGRIINFRQHQVINKAKVSKISKLSITWDTSGSDTVQIPYEERLEGKGREQGSGTGREGISSSLRSDESAPARSKPGTKLPEAFPDNDAVTYAQRWWGEKRRFDLQHDVREQAEAFRDHHTSHGTISKDWRASWRTWVRNALKFNRKEQANGRYGTGVKAVGEAARHALAAIHRRRETGGGAVTSEDEDIRGGRILDLPVSASNGAGNHRPHGDAGRGAPVRTLGRGDPVVPAASVGGGLGGVPGNRD